jgi:hypothetical protein
MASLCTSKQQNCEAIAERIQQIISKTKSQLGLCPADFVACVISEI